MEHRSTQSIILLAAAATIAAAATLIFPPTARAQGRKIRVPQDHPTIQQAINFADDGDTVIVDDGVWTGPGNRGVDLMGSHSLCAQSTVHKAAQLTPSPWIGHFGFIAARETR